VQELNLTKLKQVEKAKKKGVKVARIEMVNNKLGKKGKKSFKKTLHASQLGESLLKVQELALKEYKKETSPQARFEEDGRETVLLSHSSNRHLDPKGEIATTYESERSSVFNENLYAHGKLLQNATTYI